MRLIEPWNGSRQKQECFCEVEWWELCWLEHDDGGLSGAEAVVGDCEQGKDEADRKWQLCTCKGICSKTSQGMRQAHVNNAQLPHCKPIAYYTRDYMHLSHWFPFTLWDNTYLIPISHLPLARFLSPFAFLNTNLSNLFPGPISISWVPSFECNLSGEVRIGSHTFVEFGPAQIWEDLKTIHQTCGFASRITLHCKFLWLSKAEDQPMSSWIANGIVRIR